MFEIMKNIYRNHFDDTTKNKLRYIVGYAARSIALLFASGTLMQAFLSTLGFAPRLIYMHASLLQGVNMLTILLASSWADRGSVIHRTAVTALPTGILFLLYIPMSVINSASFESYLLLIAIGLAQQISIGLFTVCEYKLPYYIFRVEEYGRVISICGIVSSLLSLAVSALISVLSARLPFSMIMSVSFLVSALLMGFNYLTARFQKDIRKVGHVIEKGSILPVTTILKRPLFMHLIPANLLRGIALGITTVLATVALERGFNEELTAAMVATQSAASLIACAVFALFAKRTSPCIFLITGSFAVALLPFLLTESSALFLTIYALILFGRTLIDYAVPAILILIVHEKIAGPYHAWRIALQSIGALAATMVAAYLPIPWLLTIGAISQIISGISYYTVSKKYKKEDLPG